jgi:calcium-dependent protein kinase
MWTRTGTIFYQAPEIFEGGGYDAQVDMWALGVILFQMLPYHAETIMDTISLISEQTEHYENDQDY